MDVHGAPLGDVLPWIVAGVVLYRGRLRHFARSWPSWGPAAVVIATVLPFVFATAVTIKPPAPADQHTALQWLGIVSVVAMILLLFAATAERRRDRDNEAKNDAKHEQMHRETREQNERLRAEERAADERRWAEERAADERRSAEEREQADRRFDGMLVAIRETMQRGEPEAETTPSPAPGSDEAEALALASDLLRMVNVQEVTDPFFEYFQLLKSSDPEVRDRAREQMKERLSEHYTHLMQTVGIYQNRYRQRVRAVIAKLLPKNNGGNFQMNMALNNVLTIRPAFIRQIAAYLRALAGGEVYDPTTSESAEARFLEQNITIAAIHKEVHAAYMREERRRRDDLWKRARDMVWKIEELTLPLRSLAARTSIPTMLDANDPLARILATGNREEVIEEERRKALAAFRVLWDDLEPMLREFSEFSNSFTTDTIRTLAKGGYPEYDDLDAIAAELLSLNTRLQDMNLDD
jgi:hypothetical protein